MILEVEEGYAECSCPLILLGKPRSEINIQTKKKTEASLAWSKMSLFLISISALLERLFPCVRDK